MITLGNYLKNPQNFSDEDLKRTVVPIETEHFTIDNIKKDIVMEGFKKFYEQRGYFISDGSLDGTFHIKKEDELVAIATLTPLGVQDTTHISITLWE